jgi:hypothetical protein
VTIVNALGDRNLFGALPAFRDLETWSAWRAFLASVYGLPMTEAELATFRAHTARPAPRPGGYSEAVAIVGRQSGKTRLAAAIATFEAISAEREPGSELFAVLVAQDQRAAQDELPVRIGAVRGVGHTEALDRVTDGGHAGATDGRDARGVPLPAGVGARAPCPRRGGR